MMKCVGTFKTCLVRLVLKRLSFSILWLPHQLSTPAIHLWFTSGSGQFRVLSIALCQSFGQINTGFLKFGLGKGTLLLRIPGMVMVLSNALMFFMMHFLKPLDFALFWLTSLIGTSRLDAYCGICAIRFLHHRLLGRMLPTELSDVTHLQKVAKEMFIDSVTQASSVPRPWMWANGMDPSSHSRLLELLVQHGVPSDLAEARAHVLTTAVGFSSSPESRCWFPLLGEASKP